MFRRHEHPVGILEVARLDPVKLYDERVAACQEGIACRRRGQMKSAIAKHPTVTT
jgi:hypothetical protein